MPAEFEAVLHLCSHAKLRHGDLSRAVTDSREPGFPQQLCQIARIADFGHNVGALKTADRCTRTRTIDLAPTSPNLVE